MGPWKLPHDERPWSGPDHAAYLPMLPTPWIDPDGNGGTLLFTGDWAKHGNDWYGFMTQSFRIGDTPPPLPPPPLPASKSPPVNQHPE